MDANFKKACQQMRDIALELVKLSQTKEKKVCRSAKRPFHDGISYYQSCMDDEWERWEKDATLIWDKKL